jgi:GxxExxY protein
MGLIGADLTEDIIAAAIEVHRELGPGLLERTYRKCLVKELQIRHIPIETERLIDLDYKGLHISGAYRLDLLVKGSVIVELKAVPRLEPVFTAQLLTYMRLHGAPIGLLINFSEPVLYKGIKRFIL